MDKKKRCKRTYTLNQGTCGPVVGPLEGGGEVARRGAEGLRSNLTFQCRCHSGAELTADPTSTCSHFLSCGPSSDHRTGHCQVQGHTPARSAQWALAPSLQLQRMDKGMDAQQQGGLRPVLPLSLSRAITLTLTISLPEALLRRGRDGGFPGNEDSAPGVSGQWVGIWTRRARPGLRTAHPALGPGFWCCCQVADFREKA